MSSISVQKGTYFTKNNADYIESLYQQYLTHPQTLDKEWQRFFEGFELGWRKSPDALPQTADRNYIDVFRDQAYHYAQIDPLNLTNKDPQELCQQIGVQLGQKKTHLNLVSNQDKEKQNGADLQNSYDIFSSLIKTYCGSLSVQLNNCSQNQRAFFIQEFETKGIDPGLTAEQKKIFAL